MTKPILFFLCLNDHGGAEISMLKLAQGMLMQNRAVTVAVYGARPGLARALGFTGTVVDLNATRTLAAAWRLRRLLKRQKFSTLISALTHTNIAAILTTAAMRAKIHIIATEHGLDGLSACASPFFRWITRRAYCRAATVAVSQELARQWRLILPPATPVIVIYNPVVADSPPPLQPPAHPWLADKSIPVIIGIGRLKPEKNFGLLLKAFALLTQPARLIILGEGEQRPVLEQQAGDIEQFDGILLPGFVAEPDRWLAHASLFVSSSNREGFGNALVEALSHGIPVVATDCPYGPAEILEKGRYGRLVPPGDAAALAQAMQDALASLPDTAHLRVRAAAFTVSQSVAAYLKLVDNPPRS